MICQTKNIFYSKTLGKTFVLMLCSGIFVRKEKHKYHWAVQNILYNLGKIFIFWQFSYLKHNVKYPKTHVNDITQWTQLLSQFRTEPDYHKIKRIHKETKMRGTWALTYVKIIEKSNEASVSCRNRFYEWWRFFIHLGKFTHWQVPAVQFFLSPSVGRLSVQLRQHFFCCKSDSRIANVC